MKPLHYCEKCGFISTQASEYVRDPQGRELCLDCNAERIKEEKAK